MPTYEELQAFVQDIASSDNIVLAARANKVLGVKPPEFDPKSITMLPYFGRYNDEGYIENELTVMAINYGSVAIECVINHISEYGVVDGWDEFVVPLGSLDHPESSDIRKQFLERQLILVENSNRLAYRLLNALAYVGGDYVDTLKAFVNKWKDNPAMAKSIVDQAQLMITSSTMKKSDVRWSF